MTRTASYENIAAYSASFISRIGKRMPGSIHYSQIEGESKALIFGRDFHTALLEPELYKGDDIELRAIVRAIRSNVTVSRLLSDKKVKVEQWKRGWILGRRFKGILDVEIGRTGIDFKTTTARNLEEFIKLFNDYGYWNQAYIYMKLAKLTRFFFIGIQKRRVQRKAFFVNVGDFPERMAQAPKDIKDRIEWYEKVTGTRLDVQASRRKLGKSFRW